MSSFYGGAVNDLKIIKDDNGDYSIEQNGQTTEGSVHIPQITFKKNEKEEYEIKVDNQVLGAFFIPKIEINQENQLIIQTTTIS